MSRQFYFTLTYGVPLSIIACSPWPSSCALHSTCRWLQLPPVDDYSPLLYRLTSTPCERLAWPPQNLTHFLFLIACHLRAWFSPSIPQLSAMPSICFYTNTFVRSRSAFFRYILSGAKLVTAPLVRKVRARFGATLGAKKISTIIPGQDYSSNSSRPYGSILFRKPCKHFSEHL